MIADGNPAGIGADRYAVWNLQPLLQQDAIVRARTAVADPQYVFCDAMHIVVADQRFTDALRGCDDGHGSGPFDVRNDDLGSQVAVSPRTRWKPQNAGLPVSICHENMIFVDKIN